MSVEQILFPVVRQASKYQWFGNLLGRLDKRTGNPFDPEVRAWPYPQLEQSRPDGPVLFNKVYRQWVITGHEEARQALAASETSVEAQIQTLLGVRPYPKLSPLAREQFSLLMPVIDDPQHARLRRLVGSAFTPKQIRRLEDNVAGIARRLLDEIADDPEPDMFATYNHRLPIQAIAFMLGVPEEAWPWVQSVHPRINCILDALAGFDPDDVNEAFAETYEFFEDLAEARRADPQDDLMTALVEANEAGDQLSTQELVATVTTLLFAGIETTSAVLGNAMVALARHPDQRELIRSQPELWPNAADELLRWDAPIEVAQRTATEDLTIGGETIKAGSAFVVSILMANRDPDYYDDPNVLRLDRQDPRPMSFGHGIHHCLGAALARLELRVGMQEFLDDFGDYTIDDSQIRWKPNMPMRGPAYLPVRRG